MTTEIHPVTSIKQRPCQMFDLGLISYHEAFQLQKRLQQGRINGENGDTILVLQHYPVITLGKSGKRENIIVSDEFLAKKHVAIVHSDRGGDVTFHNPGQLVVYFVLNLRLLQRSTYPYQYVRDLEEVALTLLSDFGITGHRIEGYAGVWVGNDKICAIGLNVSHQVSMHGFALNVNNSLEFRSLMRPCGIVDRGITSMSEVLQREITVTDVMPSLIKSISHVFNLDIHYHQTGDSKAVSS